MSDKRKLSTILGICGATVLAGGGSAFLTDTGLSLLDNSQQQVISDAETEQTPQETEQPLSVEQFAETADSFKITLTKDDADSSDGSDSSAGETAAMYATGNVNVRSSADAESEVLTTLSEGDEVVPTGKTDGDWVEVTVNGQTGYVYKDYLESRTSGSGTSAAGQSGSSAGTSTGSTDSTDNTAADSTGSGSSGTTSDGTTMYTTSGLNVRSSASKNSDVLGTLDAGTAVTVLEDDGSGWTKISYNGQTAYVGSNYLSSSQSGSSSGSSSTGNSSTGSSSAVTIYDGTTMYATDYLYVRSGPSKSSSQIGSLSPGEAVTATGYATGGFTEIVYNGQTGYVGSNYLSGSQSGSSSGGSSSGGSSGSSSTAWDSSYSLYDINSRYISADELSGWSASDLAILRNEIFARHGRIFTTQTYSNYFSQKTWYTPTYDPSYFDANLGSFLNDYEWANLAVIQKLEDQLS